MCPGWVRTAIMDADRDWPARLGDSPSQGLAADVLWPHYERAIGEGMDPAAVADLVAEAIASGRFWALPHPEFVERAVRRWHRIADGLHDCVADLQELDDRPAGSPTANRMTLSAQHAG